MTGKRYSIVRVDNHCPEGLYENIKPNTLCPKDGDCEKCKYGDTKEQLIKKVEQVLKRETETDGILISYKKSVLWEDLAKEIVEFLGVEE